MPPRRGVASSDLMLAPLSEGKHSLHFTGTFPLNFRVPMRGFHPKHPLQRCFRYSFRFCAAVGFSSKQLKSCSKLDDTNAYYAAEVQSVLRPEIRSEERSWLVRPARHGSPNLGLAPTLSLAKGLWWREAPTICRCTTASPHWGFSSTPIS
jgi:hypothetical protein